MRLLFLCAFQFVFSAVFSQQSVKEKYEVSFKKLDSILKRNGSFKDAVFITETTYYDDDHKANNFYQEIEKYKSIISAWMKNNSLQNYNAPDSNNLNLNFAVYHFLKGTITAKTSLGVGVVNYPFTYDFEDFEGQRDWSNMFVTKLINSHKGNCHSLPYLYKILADELGATCWLSFAPNHIYIKNRSQKAGWYNTELTSGTFPVDAWIATSGYVPIEAIRNGIYMDTLSNQQAIAQCILDLAKGYEFKTKNYQDDFILKCCDLVLQYHPVNVQAILFKAETLKQVYLRTKSQTTYKEMESLYSKLVMLGYREMPEKMYMQWLRSAIEQGNKYNNKKINETLQ
jgi:hypothetical protein